MGNNSIYDIGALAFLYLRNISVLLIPIIDICFALLFHRRYKNSRKSKIISGVIFLCLFLLSLVPVVGMLWGEDWIISAAIWMIYPTFAYLLFPPLLCLLFFLYYRSISNTQKKKYIRAVFIVVGSICCLVCHVLFIAFIAAISFSAT